MLKLQVTRRHTMAGPFTCFSCMHGNRIVDCAENNNQGLLFQSAALKLLNEGETLKYLASQRDSVMCLNYALWYPKKGTTQLVELFTKKLRKPF